MNHLYKKNIFLLSILTIIFSSKLSAQTFAGADYSFVGCRFNGGQTIGINEPLTGQGFRVSAQKKVKHFALEGNIFYNNLSGKPGYTSGSNIYNVINFSMQPEQTYGFSINVLYYLFSDFLYCKAGCGMASSTNFRYSINTQFYPQYTPSSPYTENLEVSSNRVLGGGFNFGSGLLVKLRKKLYLKAEIDYFYSFYPDYITKRNRHCLGLPGFSADALSRRNERYHSSDWYFCSCTLYYHYKIKHCTHPD